MKIRLIKLKAPILVTLVFSFLKIFGQNNIDLEGHWIGTEDLNTPNISYEYRNISIHINEGGEREGFLVYTSSSDFLYNDDLNWAYHYKKFDKSANQITFLRRFITPLGVVGHEELEYTIIEFENDFLLAVHESIAGDIYHQIRLERTSLNLENVILEQFSSIVNFPNPFNPKTQLNIFVENTGSYQIKIYNIIGEEVALLFNGLLGKGELQLDWNGQSDYGQNLSSGIYFGAVIKDGMIINKHRMILLK